MPRAAEVFVVHTPRQSMFVGAFTSKAALVKWAIDETAHPFYTVTAVTPNQLATSPKVVFLRDFLKENQ